MNGYRVGFSCSILLLGISAGSMAGPNPDWTAPQKPFRIAGNLYYVGSRDLAAYLVTTTAGNILINTNLKTSPPQIRRSVEKLGFKWKDTRIILNSQAHFDHTAGLAEVVQQTHGKVIVMQGDADVVETGDSHDFSGDPNLIAYTPVHVDRILHDEDLVKLGGSTLVAHKTAGHTRGCTTWSLKVREGSKSLDVVIVGGLFALDSYRFIDSAIHHASYPGIARDFRASFVKLKSLPCDIFLGAHGSYFNLQAKLAKASKLGSRVWIDPAGYLLFIKSAETDLKKRVDSEKSREKR